MKKECIAMLLAGGQGSRLGALTKRIAKPAVSFGGKYRIIDFALSNCTNSHIDTVGVLTQYRPYLLNSYIGTGRAWDLDSIFGGVSILPPYATETGGEWYKGTADAICQNLDFIRRYNPDYVLILSGDHLYRMDYREMLKTHIDNRADFTVSVMHVPMEEASRFGIMTADAQGKVLSFQEKPKEPESDLASMGIYIFNRKVLEEVLTIDRQREDSDHDFGKNVIPYMFKGDYRCYCHKFSGFWRDVGTIGSYYDTSMELLGEDPAFDISARSFQTMSVETSSPPHFIGPESSIEDCIIGNGSSIMGTAAHSVISVGSRIGKGAVVKDSVLLPGARVEDGAQVYRTIVNEDSVIPAGEIVGSQEADSEITVWDTETAADRKEEQVWKK